MKRPTKKVWVQPWQLLVVSHVAVGFAGFTLAPQQQLETEVRSAGFFATDTRRVLAATVNSLRSENRLLIYSYRSSAVVTAERRLLWLFSGHQEMRIAGAVGYFVDLSKLTPDRVTYDERTQTVAVDLPPLLLGDVALEPEQARQIQGGILTWSQARVDELSAENYASARRAVIAQAQSATLLNAARREARAKVEGLFALPLRAAGHPTVRVVATFGGR